MLYYLFSWLHKSGYHGTRIFQYISFRSAMAFVLALIISVFIGKYFIQYLKKKQIGESIRDLGLAGQNEKAGTPTMGGLIIIAAILIPALLLCDLSNIYIILMLFTTVWLGVLGFSDDYIKVFKKNKDGLSPRKKLIGQIVLGIFVGATMYFHPDAMISEKKVQKQSLTKVSSTELLQLENQEKAHTPKLFDEPHHSSKTTIPFVKGNEFDYAWLISWMGDWTVDYVWVVYVIVAILVVTAVSNASNLTDGIDGLATGTASIIGGALAILAWVSGNIIMANYLNIVYLADIGELTIFITAFVGATLGFLWFNTFPAEVFMGDTGSLALGGIIAVFALLIRKELLLPILCGIYVVEDLSVICQTYGCKHYRRKHKLPPDQPVPIEKRPFLMTPLHHHYQKQGIPEPKIVQRFVIIGILLAIISIVTLKLR